jgi:hypothetical protein
MPIGQLISSSVLILVDGICTDGNFEWNSDTFIRPNPEEHLQKMQIPALLQESNLWPCHCYNQLGMSRLICK